MEKTIYYCDNCKSQNHNIDYQLDNKNFVTLRLEIWSNNTSIKNQRDVFKICLNCAPNIITDINNLISNLKQNQKDLGGNQENLF